LTPQSVLSGVLYPKDNPNAERLIRVLLTPQRSTEAHALGHVLLAYRAVTHGRLRDAQAELVAVDSLDHGAALEHGALFAVLPFNPIPRPDLEQARARLSAWNAAAVQRRGRTAEALAELEQMHMRAGYEPGVASPFFSEALERFLRAEALEEAGRREDALLLCGSFREYSLYDQIYLGPASLARGRLLEQLGRRQEAVREYARFIDLWQDCDPELRPLLREARLALSRLGSQSGH
jgi:tetratricopeptide (TPR) repeat protein